MDQSSNNRESSISNLAEDHICSILLLLPSNSILNFSLTCKKFLSLVSSDTLWENICRRDWGPTCVDALKVSSLGDNGRNFVSWMKLYKQVAQLRAVSCQKLSDHPVVNNLVPCQRASHSLNFVSNCLVLFGGGCEGGRHCDDTWVGILGHDLRSILKWQKVTSGVPTGRFGHTCVEAGDYLILYGGINDHGIRQNDTWVGRIDQSEAFGITVVWRPVDMGLSSPPPPRGAHAGCSMDDRMMLIHGGIGLDGVRLGDMWVLKLSEDYCQGTWHEILSVSSPSPRSGHTLTRIDGTRAILFGGRGLGYDVLDDVWLSDSSEGYHKWVKVQVDLHNVPRGISLARVGHSATLILGGGLLIFGGEDSQRRRKDDFWLLDLNSIPGIKLHPYSASSRSVLTRMWRRLRTHGFNTKARSFHAACVDHSGRYVFMYGGMLDGVVQPAASSGLRFDGDLFLVELCFTNN